MYLFLQVEVCAIVFLQYVTEGGIRCSSDWISELFVGSDDEASEGVARALKRLFSPHGDDENRPRKAECAHTW